MDCTQGRLLVGMAELFMWYWLTQRRGDRPVSATMKLSKNWSGPALGGETVRWFLRAGEPPTNALMTLRWPPATSYATVAEQVQFVVGD